MKGRLLIALVLGLMLLECGGDIWWAVYFGP
jgi:hypothetical protein